MTDSEQNKASAQKALFWMNFEWKCTDPWAELDNILHKEICLVQNPTVVNRMPQ